MRGLTAFIVLTAIGLGASGGETAKTNTLSPKEAAAGWLLLFDGETTFGWQTEPSAKVSIKDKLLKLDAGSIRNTTAFGQFALQFQCRVIGSEKHSDAQLTFAGIKFDLGLPKEKTPTWMQGKLMVAEGRYRFTLKSERGVFLKEGLMPGGAALPPKNVPYFIGFNVADGVQLELRDVILLPVQMESLFNGRNLEGWKEFPGKKSKFSVNDKLELNIKDGPGDIQTEGKYGDFVLQLECFSHGKGLNSGVFFRCIAGQYQNGYEAQIHNSFNTDAPKVYVLEDYDAKTHQLIGKRKEKFAATDWGTGSIYRRVPARKGVAKDGEWFTFTVVAHGNHFATWVNGIQVVDWNDHRPPNENPRSGFRSEAGHISFQGHDPTTNLSFRNIRIQEYAAPKK